MSQNVQWGIEEELIKRYIEQKSLNFKYSKSVFAQKEQICASTFNNILRKHGYLDLIKKRTCKTNVTTPSNEVKVKNVKSSTKYSELKGGDLSASDLALQVINGSC